MIDTLTNHERVVRYSSGHSTGGSLGDAHVEASLLWETVEILQVLAARIDPLDATLCEDDIDGSVSAELFHLKAATNRIAARLGAAAAEAIAQPEGTQCHQVIDWLERERTAAAATPAPATNDERPSTAPRGPPAMPAALFACRGATMPP